MSLGQADLALGDDGEVKGKFGAAVAFYSALYGSLTFAKSGWGCSIQLESWIGDGSVKFVIINLMDALHCQCYRVQSGSRRYFQIRSTSKDDLQK